MRPITQSLAIIALVATIALSQPAHADLTFPNQGITEEEFDELPICALLEMTAGGMMVLRQNGTPLSEALRGAEGIYRVMALAAYRTARFRSESLQQQAVDTFSTEWALQCYESLGDAAE